MSLELEIRAMHAKGYNRTQISRALGIPYYKLKAIYDDLSDLIWAETKRIAPRPKSEDQYTLRGVTATLQELMKRFNVEWTPYTVRRRLREGMSLEDAFFSGRPKIRSWYREMVGPGVSEQPFAHSAQRAS
jgi:hypothetical protein